MAEATDTIDLEGKHVVQTILVEPESESIGEINVEADIEATAPAPIVEDLPEKFQGKSVSDVVEMYQNLESEHGRVANEFGTLRQQNEVLNDVIRGTQTDVSANEPAPVEAPTVDAVKLLDDPTSTLEEWYSNRRAADDQAYEQRIASLESRLTSNDLRHEHSDVNEVVRSAEFAGWVKESATRQRVAASAAQGDANAVRDLVSDFKRETAQAAPAAPADPAAVARARASETSLEAPGASEQSSNKPVFRASELIRLKQQDREKYEDPAFQREVALAYNEGRVIR